MASHALRPVGKAFRELRSDMGAEAHVDFVADIKAQWPDLVSTDEPEKARRILIDLAEANVARIEDILEKHGKEMPRKSLIGASRHLGFDASPEGELIRRHQVAAEMGCSGGSNRIGSRVPTADVARRQTKNIGRCDAGVRPRPVMNLW